MSETRCTSCGISTNDDVVCDECQAKAERCYYHCPVCGDLVYQFDNCECDAYDSPEEYQEHVHVMIKVFANQLHDANDDHTSAIKARLDYYQQRNDQLDEYVEQREIDNTLGCDLSDDQIREILA